MVFFRRRKFVKFPRRKFFKRKKFVKKMRFSRVNPEFKYADVSAGTSITPVGSFILMNGIVQGTSAVARIGQRIIIRSIYVTILLYGQTIQPYSMLRFLIVQDKQPNGAVFTLGSLFEVPTAGVSTLSPLNYDNMRRYKILWDRHFVLNNTEVQEKYIKIYKKVFIPVEYNINNAGTVADINKNSLYLLLLNTDNINVPSCTYYSRIRYVDS